MKRSKFTEEQIPYALRQHDAGTRSRGFIRSLKCGFSCDNPLAIRNARMR